MNYRTQGRLGSWINLRALAGVAVAALILSANSRAQTPAQSGQWSDLIDWPLEGIHAILTTQGEVLLWGWGECEPPVQEDTHLWNPVNEHFTEVFPGEDFFCGGHAPLADGRILVAGGGCHGEFHNKAMTFGDAPSGPWEYVYPMDFERWYPTLTTLPDGRVLATSGQDAMQQPVTVPEVYDPQTNAWTVLGLADLELDLYPLMFVAPDGRVFHAGRNASEHGFLDIDTQTWGDFLDAPGFGADSSAVMYAPGRILKAGGTIGGADNARIDLTASDPLWESLPIMNVSRKDHDLIVLPNGLVLAVGGNATDLRAEWIDPNEPDPEWQALAATNVSREYHSTTLLLPDGRVLAAGGGVENAEVFSPPYLFIGTGRPEIRCAPENIHYGANFFIDVAAGEVGPEEIAAVSLVRLGAITHGFDQNQRFVQLTDDPIIDTESNRLQVPAPENANIAPPGYYMVFLISDDGVPSEASFVQVVECPAECSADVNGDGTVDVVDLLELLACWGPIQDPECEAADLDGNGVVEVIDLLALLAAWGECASCDTECPPATVDDCWERYHDDMQRYEACVEWVAERESYYPAGSQ